MAIDALAARVLVKGEPLSAPAGRADDFAWPRREVGHERVKGEPAMALASPDVERPGNGAGDVAKTEKASQLELWTGLLHAAMCGKRPNGGGAGGRAGPR